MAFAHSKLGHSTDEWEPLEKHLADVACLGAEFANAFGAREWGELAGRWHDLGKYQPDFQRYIKGEIPVGPPHAWMGAIFALRQNPQLGLPLAAAIAAHHGSLADTKPDEANGVAAGNTLAERINVWQFQIQPLERILPPKRVLPPFPPFVTAHPSDLSKVDMFTRFLFSTLIDADRTATARYYAQFIPPLIADDLIQDDISVLAARLDATIDAMRPKGSPAVMDLRRQVLAACRRASAESPGRFSLTVPTGCGKTLSAMTFALNHAKIHGLRRVIVVIPYTSIIEQSARVYRDVLNYSGVQNVIEHHSNLDEQILSEQDARGEGLRKLAAENWKAPIIVTTTVQFFESLLAAHGSRCRKVHNIAKSVILLDEVQTLSPQYLETIIDVLGQLTDGYGCSVVLATATPPALVVRSGSSHVGLTNVHEIMPDPSVLATAAMRVKVEWRIDQPTPYTDLAREVREHRQVLTIVHRRDDARALAEAVDGDVLHLSAAMCPAHRLTVIADVRRRLAAGEPCRLISTQLIEAGVDVDFPIVYRSLAGLDSIAQSAGRCDREGKLTDAAGAPAGRMIVFRAETEPPPGTLRKALQSMEILLKLGGIDPFEPKDSLRFFDEFYRKIDLDARRVQPLRRALAFASVADTFNMIDTDTHAIVIPYQNETIDGPARIVAFIAQPTLQTVRALQPLIVQVRRYQRDALREAGITRSADDFDRFDLLCEGREAESYHAKFGLRITVGPTLPAEASIV